MNFSKIEPNFDGLVQDSSNSSALAMELLQSCTKPSIWYQFVRTYFPRLHNNKFDNWANKWYVESRFYFAINYLESEVNISIYGKIYTDLLSIRCCYLRLESVWTKRSVILVIL